VFVSGWAWLVVGKGVALKVLTTANQDSHLMGSEIAGASGYLIVGLDVWEHAYYLKYQNKRLDYIKAFWNIVNWDEAAMRYEQSKCAWRFFECYHGQPDVRQSREFRGPG